MIGRGPLIRTTGKSTLWREKRANNVLSRNNLCHRQEEETGGAGTVSVAVERGFSCKLGMKGKKMGERKKES